MNYKITQRRALCQRLAVFLGCLFLGISVSSAQGTAGPRNNQGTIITADFAVGGTLSMADMKDRFGELSNFGLGVDLLTQNNWIFGAEFTYLYGSSVKENVLEPYFNDEGYLYGDNLEPAFLAYRMRGQFIGGRVGKLFPLGPENSRSGIRVVLGAGLLQHKIRIQQDPVSFVPQVVDNYAKGLDRLTNGLALRQFIGYQYMAVNRRVNFYAGIDLYQGFTQNRRSINIDTQQRDTTSRTDLLSGIRLGWILPFYTGAKADEIYY